LTLSDQRLVALAGGRMKIVSSSPSRPNCDRTGTGTASYSSSKRVELLNFYVFHSAYCCQDL